MKKAFLILIFLAAIGSTIHAGGFQVALQGQRQAGMGLLGTGFLTGPSIVYYNPGGMSFLQDNFSLSLGVSPIVSNVAFQYEAPSLYETTTDNPTSLPFTLYSAGKINDKLALGLGVYTPFGSTTIWGDDWRGRYIIQDISLLSVFIQPTVSYKITNSLGIGVGFIYAYGDVTMHKGIPLEDQSGEEGQATIEGSTSNYGFNAGLYFTPSDKLSIGATYRSKITMEMNEGNASFDVPEALAASFPDTKFKTELPLPASVNIGISYHMNEKLSLGADFNYVFWEEYESLDFDFETNTDALQDIVQPKNYSNGAIYRIGLQYKVSEKLNARTGFYYDSPVVGDDYYAPETPDAVKLGFTGGISYSPSSKLSIDLSYLQIIGLERTASYMPENFGGTYKYNAFIPGVGVNYKF